MSEYLGVGLQFPLNLVDGSANLVSDNLLIQQSIVDILNTPKGGRFFLPQYGSRLRELIFEVNDDLLIDLMKVFIVGALNEWEKRIAIKDVIFDVRDTTVDCRITYTVLSRNEVDSFIYPFYRKIKT